MARARYDNAYVADVFVEMAELLQIEGGDPFRARAFKRNAQVIAAQREPLAGRLAQGALSGLKGMGAGSVGRIKDILRTGTCQEHQRLRQKLPPGLRALLDIKGIGPRHARILYHQGGITNLEHLAYATQQGHLVRLPGLPADFSVTVQQGLALLSTKKARVTLHEGLRLGAQVIAALKDDPAIAAIQQTGSARRRKKSLGDLDVLVASEARARVVEQFTRLPNVEHVFVAGDGRASVRLREGVQFDLRVIPPEQFGAGMHYFTGSRAHNIAIRLRANRMNLKVSDHGIFQLPDETRRSPAPQEKDIFDAVGLPFIPPELREDMGEIEAALKGRLPVLVGRHDVVCDHLVHGSTSAAGASDGGPSDDDFVRAAVAAKSARLREVIVDIGERAVDETLFNALRRAEEQTDVVVTPVRVTVLGDDVPPAHPDVLAYATLSDARADDAHALLRAHLHIAPLHALRLDPDATVDVGELAPLLNQYDIAVLVVGREGSLTPDDALVRAFNERGVRFALASGAHGGMSLDALTYAVYIARRGWCGVKNVVKARRAQAHAIEPRQRTAASLVMRIETNPVLQQLQQGDLDDALVARAKAFLAGEPDAEFAAALDAITDNPLQAAFNLVLRAEGAQVLDD